MRGNKGVEEVRVNDGGKVGVKRGIIGNGGGGERLIYVLICYETLFCRPVVPTLIKC